MSQLENLIFGPLGKEACNYFYFLTAFAFFSLVIFFFSAILIVVKRPRTITRGSIFNGVLLFFNLLIAYFVNRVFYNICKKTL
jgi:uncharacterized Tic20 family protein